MPIILKKTGDTHKIDLSKKSASQQLVVHVNLNWNQTFNQRENTGLFGNNSPPDLDLGCMYEMLDGSKGVIQPLGGNFGNQNAHPYIFLDKDDRTGAATDGENMFIYKPELIKRVMFFALIYKGARDFQSVGGRMFFKITNGEEVNLELDSPDINRPFCAAAMITKTDSTINISKEEKYFAGHEKADKNYNFGFRWVAGSK